MSNIHTVLYDMAVEYESLCGFNTTDFMVKYGAFLRAVGKLAEDIYKESKRSSGTTGNKLSIVISERQQAIQDSLTNLRRAADIMALDGFRGKII